MSDGMRDESILELLAAALDAADPVPQQVLDAAKAALTWRTVDAELAALLFDSATEELVGVRGVATPRQMTFAGAGVEIELMLFTEPTRRIVGQVVPEQAAIVVLSGGSEITASADDLGRFTLADVPVGHVRLTCRLPGADRPVIQTEWTSI